MTTLFSRYCLRARNTLSLLGLTLGAATLGAGPPDVLEVRAGSQLSWATVVGRTYQAQWASSPTGPWNDWGTVQAGTGQTFSVDDFTPGGGRHFRILETTPGSTAGVSLVANGGFENGDGASAENWTLGASQPPVRSDLDARTGTFSLRARIQNVGSSPAEGLASYLVSSTGGAVIGGQTYNFSFYGKQVLIGSSYIQQYEVQWLNSSGGAVGGTGLTNFTGAVGTWQQFAVNNLVAPTAAVDARIRFRMVTGAVAGGAGEIFIDDVTLTQQGVFTPAETVSLEPAAQSVLEVSWLSRPGIPYQPLVSADLSNPDGWTPFGSAIGGNGAVRTLVLPTTSAPLFLRLSYPGGSEDPIAFSIVPLHGPNTVRDPDIQTETSEALITRVGDRARDRHAREGTGTVTVNNFDQYDHYLPFYWEDRTLGVEIIDRVAKGGTTITFNYTTVIRLTQPEFRAFFLGRSTVAEYHFNALGTLIDPQNNVYTVTIDRNHQYNRPLQLGDRVEIEISMFLSAPRNGRTNYYGTTLLYIVGRGIVPWQTAQTAGLPFTSQSERLDSYPIPEEAWLGGETTLPYRYTFEPQHTFKQFAGNAAPQSAADFLTGRRLHHTDFGSGAHSEAGNPAFITHAGKLGPNFNAASCVQCHVNNGRSFPPAVGQPLLLGTVNVGGDPAGSTPHPVFGRVLSAQSTQGAPQGTVRIASYTTVDGQYGDGTPYQLRRPNYQFEGAAPEYYSVRMARPLVGMGLLEAIPESTILALADPDDLNQDGISGRPQVVADLETGAIRLGRFGHKARMPSARAQIASALFHDMGVTTTTYAGGNLPELGDTELDQLERYLVVLGVQARRDLNHPQTILGHQLMEQAGCVKCHVPELQTGPYHPVAELRNQTIRPYTDLLLHDLGPDLAANLGEGVATGAEWRTAPLWNIGHTAAVGGEEAYLHDGRARSLAEAILWHGGEAEPAREAFRTLSAAEREALLAYLRSL